MVRQICNVFQWCLLQTNPETYPLLQIKGLKLLFQTKELLLFLQIASNQAKESHQGGFK